MNQSARTEPADLDRPKKLLAEAKSKSNLSKQNMSPAKMLRLAKEKAAAAKAAQSSES